MDRHSFLMSVCYIPLVQLTCNKNWPNNPSNHDDAPRPKQYTLIVRPTRNQSTPNLLYPPPNTQRHSLMCLYHQSIHHCLRDSHRHQRHQKNLHLHIWSHPMPVHLLWWQNEPPLAFKRSIIDRRQDCRVGTVEIRPKEGELWCFLAYECSKIHLDLTNPFQINVRTQPNHPKLLQPLANT
jgi:hypothetical protein